MVSYPFSEYNLHMGAIGDDDDDDECCITEMWTCQLMQMIY